LEIIAKFLTLDTSRISSLPDKKRMNEHLKKGPLQKKGNSMQESTLSSQADLFHHSVILICELASLSRKNAKYHPKLLIAGVMIGRV
jgi:hypothetical protein